jgi:hypothetical protein
MVADHTACGMHHTGTSYSYLGYLEESFIDMRNFAFLMDSDGTWRLAPFFDFTFHAGPNGWHTLPVAGDGRSPRAVPRVSPVVRRV